YFHAGFTFFNGVDPSERKITWVAWEKVLASKENGGLGVSSFHALNRALLLKWVCIIGLIIPRLGVPFFERISCWPRKALILSLIARNVLGMVRILGFGQILGSQTSLYASNFLGYSLSKKINRFLLLPSWALLRLIVPFEDRFGKGIEHQQWSDLSSLLESVILSPSKDRWFCDLNGEGAFRVKDARSIIGDIFLPSSEVATRWVKYILIKINIFMWCARFDRIPTWCNLTSRGVVLESSLCPLCGLAPEDASHVLFRCELSKHVFHRICWCRRTQNVKEAIEDESWIIAMQEELNQFVANDVCNLVPPPKNQTVIGVEAILYVDSDHVGDYVDRKSTSSVCTFMGCCLTSWSSKKQTVLAISTTEAKYVYAGKACQKAL
nr:RNA-directed DNA polymerase, eukaryota [Tanacetum cinerariifolium]